MKQVRRGLPSPGIFVDRPFIRRRLTQEECAMPMVLSISYSDVQQRTMQRTLENRGIDLTGVKSLHDALALCPQHYFDLVIVDDSIPFQDREFICARLKMECEAPLLVLIAPNEVPIQSAQYNLQGGEFASFTEVVSRILQQKGTSA